MSAKQPVASYAGLKLRFLSFEHAYAQSTIGFVEALNYNLVQSQLLLQKVVNAPLLMRSNSIAYKEGRTELDRPADKDFFQSYFHIDTSVPLWNQKLKITNQQFLAQV